MSDRRKHIRKPVKIEVRYTVTDISGTHASMVEERGVIVDISENGFGILTGYPLKRGHVITIRDGKREGLPDYGMVRWSGTENNLVRAGLSYS